MSIFDNFPPILIYADALNLYFNGALTILFVVYIIRYPIKKDWYIYWLRAGIFLAATRIVGSLHLLLEPFILYRWLDIITTVLISFKAINILLFTLTFIDLPHKKQAHYLSYLTYGGGIFLISGLALLYPPYLSAVPAPLWSSIQMGIAVAVGLVYLWSGSVALHFLVQLYRGDYKHRDDRVQAYKIRSAVRLILAVILLSLVSMFVELSADTSIIPPAANNFVRAITLPMGTLILIIFYTYYAENGGTIMIKLVSSTAVLVAFLGTSFAFLSTPSIWSATEASIPSAYGKTISYLPQVGGGYRLYVDESGQTDIIDLSTPDWTPHNSQWSTIALPFSFDFYGRSYTQLTFTPTGILFFEPAADLEETVMKWRHRNTPHITPIHFAWQEPNRMAVFSRQMEDYAHFVWAWEWADGRIGQAQLFIYRTGRVQVIYGGEPDAWGYSPAESHWLAKMHAGEGDRLYRTAAQPGLVYSGDGREGFHFDYMYRYRAAVHHFYRPQMWAATLILLVSFTAVPFFLRFNIIKPLHSLQDGIRRVTAGRLGIEMPVYFEDEVGILTRGFNIMSRALRESEDLLEQRVAERTQQLQTIADLSETLNAILNPTQLLNVLVNKLHQTFGYYFVYVYLVDEENEEISLQAGSGKNGSLIVERGHRLSIHAPQSIVAHAIRETKTILLPDVSVDERWLSYDLLPDIRGELVVPLHDGDKTLGVLGIQSKEIDALDNNDVWLLRSLASQVVIAFRNAQLYEELEQRASELGRAKKLADAANQAKSDFLAGMSHELRTPLNGILGYAQIMELDNSLQKRQRLQVSTIRRSGEHLLSLINDILDLTKIEARKLELNHRPFQLSPLLEEITEMVQLQAESKELPFQHELDPDLPTALNGDAKRLKQILINLLKNAIKFTEEGQVTLRVTQLGQSDEYSLLRFEVEDTGVGMNKDQLQQIFRPFEQVGPKQQQDKGTGLGLAISQQFVNLMGGQIQVKSQPKEGSLFWFDISLQIVADAERNDNGRETRSPIAYNGLPKRILVADDKRPNLQLLNSLLTPLGFEILEVADANNLFHHIQSRQPHLIILDILMPNLDTAVLIDRLNAHPNLQNIPIIASSTDLDETVQAGLRKHYQAFLPKPMRVPRLYKLLAAHLDIEWVYPPPPPSKNKPADNTTAEQAPPPEFLDRLQHLIDLGDMFGIQDEAARLKESAASYHPFAEQVESLAQQFDESALQKLIDTHRSNP